MATFSEIGLFSGWGTGNGKVNVTLRADGEPVAAQLQERYGDAIDITVGFLHFPECAFPHSRTPASPMTTSHDLHYYPMNSSWSQLRTWKSDRGTI